MTFRNMIAITLMAGSLAGAIGLAHAQAPDILATRQAGMKATGGNAGAIKKALDAGADLTALAPKAEAIAAWGQKIPSMFPPGSDTGKTHALPAIWTDRADFEKHAADLTAAADKLAVALKANDPAAAKAAFGAMGAVCAACHRSNRAPT